MKNRRDFLKFLGLGAGAAAGIAAAVVAGRGSPPPAPAPRPIVDIEKTPFPDGDFVPTKPEMIRNYDIDYDMDYDPRVPWIPEVQRIGPDVNAFPVQLREVQWTSTTDGTDASSSQPMTTTVSPEMEQWNNTWSEVAAMNESKGAGWYPSYE